MQSIQMVDLTTQYERIQPDMDRAILDVIRSGRYIKGEAVAALAEDLKRYTGAKHVIPCGNGTDALQMALMVLDLQPGDEVIVPAFTYAACAEVIALLRLIPVLVDVDPGTFNIDVRKIEEAVSAKTKAIIPVHLFGQTADMEPLMEIARKHHLYVIEDNAQSIGSVYTFFSGEKKQAGVIGDIGVLSFFPTKNLGCYGDGGALLTNNDILAGQLQMIASHGQSQKYRHERIGCNSRLDTLQAAVLRVKLPCLPAWILARRKAASLYDAGLKNLSRIETPECIPSSTHVYHQYTLKIGKGQRDGLQQYLKAKGIPSMVYYPLPLQEQPAFRKIVRIGGDMSATEMLCRSVLSLPMHTELTGEQIKKIVEEMKSYYEE
ncbi:MAG: DegT/DnrJ/EryC1/StrS family aminotransferase [Dysgonamonadaceae bacterium]|jgi:dTDP-4-amino-4,6-dideoxygalactose transaminase|nr:DegT/DnrJ/EryC1/StrS family aminotransferase [Dysgonamonadaceae bacterium]